MKTEKYTVRLTDEECQRLGTIVKKLKVTSQKVNRIIVQFKVDAYDPQAVRIVNDANALWRHPYHNGWEL